MDYEQKYKAALNWMRSIYPTMQGAEKEDAEHYFPELKESEDEKNQRIKKEVIEMLHYYHSKSPCFIPPQFSLEETLAWLEKQGEQKPTDKVEPRFKIGDWIINNDKRIAIPTQILEIEKYGYVTSRGYTSFDKVKTDYHLWTIQDANDGDVLVSVNPFIFKGFEDKMHPNNPTAYCGIHTSNNFIIYHGKEAWTNHEVHPATKKEADFLFQKMKEAGYEWDAEKKELKKIKQKPAWSEEDEQYLLVCKNALYKYQSSDKWDATIIYNWLEEKLKSLKGRVQPQPKHEWSEEDSTRLYWVIQWLSHVKMYNNAPLDTKHIDEDIKWLKSLKPNHWKPTEEQMEALKYVVDYFGELTEHFAEYEEIESLYNDLKNL